MDTRQRLAVLVLLIHLVPQSRGHNVTSNATLILLEDQTLPLQKEKDLLSIIEKEKLIPPLENLILIQTSSDVIESPSVINDELLSLMDQQTQKESDFSERQRRSTVMDQVTAESRTHTDSVQQLDLEDIDNLQDVIAITEYEPQKIDSEKIKGKTFPRFGNTDETSTQPFDNTYYEVPRKRGSTRVPKYGTTKVSYNIKPTEKSRYLDSETHRTLQSTFDPPNGKIKLPSAKNPTMSTTSVYQLPTVPSDYNRISETQTRNYNSAFTTSSLPSHPRSTLSETKILNNFDSISGSQEDTTKTELTSTFVTSRTALPNIQTRSSISFYTPRSSKYLNNFANFDKGVAENTISTTTLSTDLHTVPSKQKKIKKVSTGILRDSNLSNIELSLRDKARQSRALNHTGGNYKFGLLAKYDIIPRPFALRVEDPLHVAAAQTQSKNFRQPQVFPTKPATLWNINTLAPTLSPITRRIVNAQRKNDSLNPYSTLGTYDPPFSTLAPYTTVVPPTTSTQRIRHGSVPPMRIRSRGRARYNSIKNDTKDLVDTKDLNNPKYSATSAEKIVASTKYGHYKTHEKPEEAPPHIKDSQSHDKKKGHREHHHKYRDEDQVRKPDHHHKHDLDKHHHDHKKHHTGHNRHYNRNEHHPKNEQNDRHHSERSHKHEQDQTKHHTRNQNHHPKDDQDDNYYDNAPNRHHTDKPSLHQETYNHEGKYGKGNHDHHKDYDHEIEYHRNDKVNEKDHHYNNNHQHHGVHKQKEKPDQSEQDEDHDHHEYEYDQDKQSDDDHQQTYDYTQMHDDMHLKDHDKKHSDDHDSDRTLHRHEHNYDDRDHEENKGESSHKHEHKHDHKKGGGDHKHEAGGGVEHEEEHHSEEGEKGDKGYESWHENEKAEKGYRDKADHSHHYDESKGDKKKHEDEGGYHKEHHFGEKGEKAAEFGEKGEHKSGHNIKGKHFIHKKDEYEKKTEFFDEFHDDGDSEKEGEFHHEHKGGKGGHHKSGHHGEGHHEEKHGKKHHHMKGHHYEEDKGHKEDEGHDEHHHHEEKHGKKGAHEEGKKWAYKKGK